MIEVYEFTPADQAFVDELYRDPECVRQMSPSSPDDSHEGTFVVTDYDMRVGVFTLYPLDDEGLGSFGFAIHPTKRGCGYASRVLEEIKIKAREMGFLSLRADVYTDNVRSLSALKSAGFREFIWMEVNL